MSEDDDGITAALREHRLFRIATVYALGRVEEAREAITEGRRVPPDLSLELIQNYFGVSRPTIDARWNAALRPEAWGSASHGRVS